MLSKSAKKLIKERKVLKHSNPTQFLKRMRNQSIEKIDDLTFLAKNLDEDELQKIFTKDNLEKLFISIMYPPTTKHNKNPSKEELDRIFNLGYMFISSAIDATRHCLTNKYANRLYQKSSKPFMDELNMMYFDKAANKL